MATGNAARNEDRMNSASEISYAQWALGCFRTRLAPVLEDLRTQPLPGIDGAVWLKVCEQGPTHSTCHRLFPGALFLLWIEALAGPDASSGAEPVAVAIELLHNA